jgi:hypothetical protein
LFGKANIAGEQVGLPQGYMKECLVSKFQCDDLLILWPQFNAAQSPVDAYAVLEVDDVVPVCEF